MSKFVGIVSLLMIFGLCGCTANMVGVAPTAVAQDPDGQAVEPVEQHFEDVTGEVGLIFEHGAFAAGVSADPTAAMGGGLCWLDYNRDGWVDLYLVNSHSLSDFDHWEERGGLPSNRLFANSEGRFVDVSLEAGVDLVHRGMGCVAGDLNRDGWPDLYVTGDGPNRLLWNQGDGTFVEGAADAGVDASEWSSAAALADLNGDGWLDLFVAAYIDLEKTVPKPSGAFPQDYLGLPDRLYLNQGLDDRGRAYFADVASEVGLTREERGLGAIFSDLDRDGDPDLYIANDGHPNRLHGVESDATAPHGFRLLDGTETAQVGDSGSGMGIALGDYDGDSWPDLFVTNWELELNALYRNLSGESSGLVFQYSTFRIGVSGLGNGLTGWGTHLADFDHDRDDDLLIVNGRVPVTDLVTDPEPMRFYRNRSLDASGAEGTLGHFLEWSGPAGLDEIGPLLGRGSALADYDRDGDLDLAISQIGARALILRNNSGGGNWLQIQPEPVVPGFRAAVVFDDGRQIEREILLGSSYLAGEEPILHWGLGTYESVARIEIFWPGEVPSILYEVEANQRLMVSSPPP